MFLCFWLFFNNSFPVWERVNLPPKKIVKNSKVIFDQLFKNRFSLPSFMHENKHVTALKWSILLQFFTFFCSEFARENPQNFAAVKYRPLLFWQEENRKVLNNFQLHKFQVFHNFGISTLNLYHSPPLILLFPIFGGCLQCRPCV